MHWQFLPFRISGAKPREMMALLVDRGEQGFTVEGLLFFFILGLYD